MRNIKYIVLHCTAGPQDQSITSIQKYWRSKGWRTDGYHYMIKADGTVVNLVPIDIPSNGVKGFNHESINISYLGGVNIIHTVVNDKPVELLGQAVDNRTPAQIQSMIRLIKDLHVKFPKAIIQGHRDFSPDKNRNGIIEPSEWMKTCPSFSVKTWLKQIGFESRAVATYKNTTATVNIREGAGVEFKLVAAPLRPGVEVKIIGEGNGWTYVQVLKTRQLGWINSRYLK